MGDFPSSNTDMFFVGCHQGCPSLMRCHISHCGLLLNSSVTVYLRGSVAVLMSYHKLCWEFPHFSLGNGCLDFTDISEKCTFLTRLGTAGGFH